MAHADRSQLMAERNFLAAQIASTPVAASLTKRSLESRLRSIESQLDAAPDVPAPERTLLTFKGKPVRGSEGIVAQFGSDALKAFSDAVTAVASSLKAPLKARGPVKDRTRLLVTGTALGSFGFELEEIPAENVDEIASVSDALEKTQALLAASRGTDDQQLAEVVQAMDPRALKSVRSFLELLSGNDASCTISRASTTVSFVDSKDVQRSIERLAPSNVTEALLELDGIFIGVLPQNRQFEFRQQGRSDFIQGKIGLSIEEPGLLTGHWGHRFRIKVRKVKVGNAKASYVLLSAQRLPSDSSEGGAAESGRKP